MISERSFVTDFSAFWEHCLPFLTPQVVSELNSSRVYLWNVSRPLTKSPGPQDSANNDLSAEFGFDIFAEAVANSINVQAVCLNTGSLKKIASRTKSKIAAMRRIPFTALEGINISTLDAVTIAGRIEKYCKGSRATSIIVNPMFRGCGFLDSCNGDILADSNLCEVKSVDRNLRSIDIRQVLTYCALNHRSAQYLIDTVTILNPRRGIMFSFAIESLAYMLARKNAGELFEQITNFVGETELLKRPS